MGQDKESPTEGPVPREKMLSAFMERLPSIAVVNDLEGRCLYANPAWEKIFRKSRDEWLGKTSEEIWPPKVAAKLKEQNRAVLQTGEPSLIVGTLRHADGPHHWISYRFPIKDTEGRIVLIGVNAIDITEHIQTKTRLEPWLEAGQTVIYTREPRGDFATTYISKNVQALIGWEPRQFLEDPHFWFNLIHPDDRPRILDQLALPWPEDRQIQEYRVQAQDSTYHWMRDSFKMVRDRHGVSVEIAGAWLDITERKAMEAQLMQAQKMEAVARLVGGVAHDFNNLLMAIMGYGELIRSSLFKDDPLSHYIEDILKAADQATSLTQQLLAFSLRQIIQPQELELNRVVADMEKMLRRLIGEDIDLETITEPELWRIRADPGQIGQIIINLAVNARDAMATGGRLTLGTANVELTEGHQGRFDRIPPGRYVRLSVRDTGVGIDAETLTHIFEPSFTKDEASRGTGLGFPVVYGIVRHNGGYLDVESLPEKGTVFAVYLPSHENALEPTRNRMPLKEKLEGSETILIVEDEMSLRSLLGRFFRLYGYDVLEARDGGEALLICERHLGPIHILLTDVVMPLMSGRELAERLAPSHPEMQVFYMSGYTDSNLAPYGISEPSKTIIPKPFRPLDLVKRVRDFLDAPKDGYNFPPA